MLLSRRLVTPLLTVVLIVIIGTVGLMTIEGWPLIDALFMTVITLSTVGYGETRPLTTAGRIFTIVLILTGVGTVFYSLTVLAEHLLEEQVAPANVRRRRMRQRVRQMRDHLIVCGYGRVGAQVAAELAREGVPVVVVDSDPQALERCAAAGHTTVAGDATEDEVLREAGIERARGLVATTNSDASNVYVVLAARSLRSDLFIVARMDREQAEAKLRVAGANRVISPHSLGGRRMASLVMRPAVVDFVDTVLQNPQTPLRLEEIQVGSAATLEGKPLAELLGPLGDAVSLLAIMRRNGTVTPNPGPAVTLGSGDVLIVLGQPEALRRLERGLVGAGPQGGGAR